LGAATLFSLILVVFSGVLLTVYYVPSPGEAHASVDYISTGVQFGSFIRGMHHWSASALVVLSVGHMIRVIAHGAYKYPREFTWFTGVALLLLVFGFGITGSLLPWDQNAYWATNVRMGIFGVIPYAGEYVARLVQGGDTISALTLARFHAAHVLVLPAVLFVLVGWHIRLVRRHGAAPTPGREH
jgi:quinol-cytochrome oxidoreductase complex cytochrome b subunit